jgi:hypothetical protein
MPRESRAVGVENRGRTHEEVKPDLEERAAAEARLNGLFRPPAPVAVDREAMSVSPILGAEPTCRFCARPIGAFAYKKPTLENAGLCTRKDCLHARRRKKDNASVKTISLKAAPMEEGDVSADLTNDAPDRHHDFVVKSDLADDSIPLLAKIRAQGSPPTTLERVQREVIAAKRAHPEQPYWWELPSPPESQRPYNVQFDPPRELVRQIENNSTSKMHMKEEQQPADPEKSDADRIRDEWQTEKFYEDSADRVVLEKLRMSVPVDFHPAVDLYSGNYFDLRKAVGLTEQQLVAFIANEKFMEPMIEGMTEQQLMSLKRRTIKTMPRRKQLLIYDMREREIMTAISRREAYFYKDYARGEELSVQEMVRRHGGWFDDDIQELEVRIICHAARLGLFVLPPHLIPRGNEYEPDDEQQQTAAIFGTGGAEIGGGITAKTRGDGRLRNLADFETPPPTKRYDPEKPYVTPGGGMFDDYNTEKG